MASPELSSHRSIDRLDDAHELKRTEEALRISEEKFSKAFKTSLDALNINRLSDGVYLEINPGFTAITGYAAGDVIGRSSLPGELGLWVNEEDRHIMVASLKACGEVIGLEAPFRMKNGQIRIGVMSARILEIGGEPCILSTTRDITEQKKTELSTLASEQKYRELANSVPVGIFESDCAGKLTFANAILFEWFGYSEAEFSAGLSLVELVSPFDRARVRENVARVLSQSRPLTNEYELTRKSGATFPVLTISRRICDRERIVGMRGILLDLTEKKKMEFAMQNMAKLDSLGVLAGGIAHDFNNLLAGIFGYIDLARSVSKEPAALEYLHATMGSMDRARALTQQLLTFAKGGSPVRKITPLVPFIQETVLFALSGSTVSCRFSWRTPFGRAISTKTKSARCSTISSLTPSRPCRAAVRSTLPLKTFFLKNGIFLDCQKAPMLRFQSKIPASASLRKSCRAFSTRSTPRKQRATASDSQRVIPLSTAMTDALPRSRSREKAASFTFFCLRQFRASLTTGPISSPIRDAARSS
jgi:PAS domain S-box-containing protein